LVQKQQAAMPKRAGAPTKARAAKAPKVVEVPPQTPVDALLDTLAQHAPADIDTLRPALPQALGAKAEERQPFQQMVLDTLKKLIADASGSRAAAVHAAEAAVTEHTALEADAAARLEAAQQEESAMKQREVDATSALAAAEADKRSADGALGAAKTALASAESAAQAKEEAARAAEGVVGDEWIVIKDGALAGKDWRARDKHIKKVVALLGEATAPASLCAAAPATLKERPENRGPFAKATVDHTEQALHNHVAALLAERDAALAAIKLTEAQAVAAAHSAVEEASSRVSVAQDASISAQNAWVDANARVSGLMSEKLAERREEVAAQLEGARAAEKNFQAVLATFEASTAPPAAGADSPAEHEATATAPPAAGADSPAAPETADTAAAAAAPDPAAAAPAAAEAEAAQVDAVALG